jgi:hypothetical protein
MDAADAGVVMPIKQNVGLVRIASKNIPAARRLRLRSKAQYYGKSFARHW